MSEGKKEPEKLVLCGYCKKPIHISEFGGVSKETGFMHTLCYVKNIKKNK